MSTSTNLTNSNVSEWSKPAPLSRFALARLDALPLSLDHAGRRIDGRWLWRDVDAQIDEGTRWAVVGPSGSGKTVLLRALAGLDRLDEGTIRSGGRTLDELSLPAHRARVHYLMQRPALFPGTVADNVHAPLKLAVHRGRGYDANATTSALDALGRPVAFLDQPIDRLSGGEQQIVALLRAFQARPDVLLLDEPTASLDPAATEAVEALVARWLDENAGRAALWTSHNPAQIARVTDYTLDLADFAPRPEPA